MIAPWDYFDPYALQPGDSELVNLLWARSIRDAAQRGDHEEVQRLAALKRRPVEEGERDAA